MGCEFEEKEYEAPLYSELRRGSQHIFTPGQVFERRFGIDAALEALNPDFWNVIGSPLPKGVVLDDYSWGFVWSKISKRRPLPTYSTNLLVQAKRGYPRKRVTEPLKSYGLQSPYWCFDTKVHQQRSLERVHRTLKNRALIVYAAPAFHTLSDLFQHTQNATTVANSNFVKVLRLTGHVRWNYSAPGTSGVANADPEAFWDEPSFLEMIQELRDEAPKSGTPNENLRILANVVVEESEKLKKINPISSFYLTQRTRMRSFRRDLFAEEDAVGDYLDFALYCSVVNCNWLVV